ncbi:MAG TPA: endonuclease [Phycisphaerae bacterium]|nr:endonuclease [Phycisphaerae bacterium]
MGFTYRTVLGRLLAALILFISIASPALGQLIDPAPMNLPVSQNWGTANFTTLPPGFAAWNGLSGGTINTQALAESSTPTGNATITGTAPTSGGAGGCYGYAVAGDARFAVNTSSNSLNGVNQLAMALNTLGQTGITLTYDLINVINNTRLVGVVCQYRVGTSGAWTMLTGTGNPYTQSGGTAGDVTHACITLPAAAENQAVVQIRWAVWRGTASGNSSAFAVDNVSVIATGGGPAVASLTLSGGPTYDLAETATATVSLAEAPAETAAVNVTSGGFAAVPVTITAPATSGTAEVSMANAGTFTATAVAASGCTGSAASGSFTVIGAPTAGFAATGNTVVDDSTGDGNGYIDPGESGVKLTIEIINNGTADATGVSGTLSSLTGAVSVTGGTRSYPDLAMSAGGGNVQPFELSAGPSLTCGSPINLQLAVTSAQGSSTILLTLTACAPGGGLYDPPADYYTTATGTGATLKTHLHNITAKDYWNGFLSSPTHHVHSYDDAKTALQITDVDPNNPEHIILLYNGASVPKSWDGGATWNREHQWPDSLGIDGSLPAYGDLHHLRPCDPSLNSARGNKSFGIGGDFWDPDHGQACRGRVARSLFYMNTRYNGTAPDPSLNLLLVNGDPPGTTNQLGDLASLLAWHYAYPVDEAERRRNEVVFSNTLNPSYYQGNRNPYIDHPEYVWAIYGTSANDSTLYLGGSVPPGGSSTANVDLGRVIVNGPAQPPQTLTLHKSGTTPTTYNVTLSGAATSSAAGPQQAFVAGPGSRNMSAGLSSPTGTPGLKSGTVTITNTDLTSAAAGQGSADGNDIVTITETVLDHANASFTTPADSNVLTIDFGNVIIGSSVHALPVTIFNLPGTPGFTAGMVLTAVTPAGSLTVLNADVAPFSTPLPAGSGAAFTATVHPDAAAGAYQATYTLSVGDESLPGEMAGTPLVLTLTARLVPAAGLPGDMDCNGLVDVADIDSFVLALINQAAYQAAFPSCRWLNADCNGDGRVDGADVQSFVSALLAR